MPDREVVPRADARVEGHQGKLVMVPYAGGPVMLTLDGSRSLDPDGRIEKFRWLSGTRSQPAAAGASGRFVPDGEAPEWPEDVEQPEVELEAGAYAFTLWVIDDRGLVSAPDTLRVQVGD